MFYLNTFAHQIFLVIFYFFWKKLNPRRLKKIKHELTIRNLIIAGLVGLVIDFLGYCFGFWLYTSQNFVEYLIIIFSTWMISAPVMLAVFDDFKGILGRFKIRPIKIDPPFWLNIIGFIGGTSVFLIFGLMRFLSSNNPAPAEFFFISLITIIIAEESLLNLLKVKNFSHEIAEGKIIAPLTIVLAGFFVGLIWELFNTHFRIWTYDHLPPGSILGIPVYVVGFYGVINYTYYNFCQIADKYLKKTKITLVK